MDISPFYSLASALTRGFPLASHSIACAHTISHSHNTRILRDDELEFLRIETGRPIGMVARMR